MRREQALSGPPGDRRARIAAQAGDFDAHELLVMSRAPKMRASVQERSRDPSEPDDMAPNVLLSIHRLRNSPLPKRRLSPLLRAIAGSRVPQSENTRPQSGHSPASSGS